LGVRMEQRAVLWYPECCDLGVYRVNGKSMARSTEDESTEQYKKTIQAMYYNVTMRRAPFAIVAVEKQ